MHERRIRLAIFSAIALSTAAATRAQELLDEDGNVLLTTHTIDETRANLDAGVPYDVRDYIAPKERNYDPRPQANLNKLRGRNFNRAIKTKAKGQGRRPS